MYKMINAAVRFLREEEGPTSVEYAVMLAFIILVCMTAVATLGSETFAKFCAAADGLAAN